jgi:hypothetical protein
MYIVRRFLSQPQRQEESRGTAMPFNIVRNDMDVYLVILDKAANVSHERA